MASVFVSYSTQDRAVTERVVGRRRAAGFAALFVASTLSRAFPSVATAGGSCTPSCATATTVIFLASEGSVASRWCFAELGLARSLGRQVFPLRPQPRVGADTLKVEL
jgi:hypothetical protein